MDDIQWKFSDKFRSHWIKVKFYKEKPDLKKAKRLKDIKFCEAINEAMMDPILLDKESISCPGAQYAFGWRSNSKSEFLKNCYDKRQAQKDILKSIISQTPYFKKPFEYIGLNTDGTPDLVMSYMPPEEVMDLIGMYNNHQGGNLNVSLCTMMSICSGIAVKTYLEDKVSFSFGCDDSRKYADMRRENLAVGIPRRLFNVFVD
ncbi:MAG: DUF169 domain-containing protein [Candidatus Omnitrophica bacterium]|nr:DUF169 domain-containing protein [Candidatus Omnitrophota bacterium]